MKNESGTYFSVNEMLNAATDCAERYPADSTRVAAMLRQAAESANRCEDLMAQCLKICGKTECNGNSSKCIMCARPVLDFVLHGDLHERQA